ncbi:hypothetical protein EVAR_58840_1 [Eumeta japonica]|uniref:Uncharacterized protein n=1 Tax=Eumeta variegata TaxID=151549 RepID=A0A4C1YRP1_EUMVA|nr:hypothetical protein EVAR_58840_1 [Eumeta japonica]
MSPTRVLVNNFIQIDNENETNKILKIYLIIGALLGADRLELCEDLKNLSKHFIRGFAFFLHVCIVITTVRYPRDGFGPRFLLAISFIEYFLYCSWAFVNPEVVCLEIANMRYKHDLKIARNSYRLIVEASDTLQSATRVQILITLLLDFIPRLIFWYIHVLTIIHHQAQELYACQNTQKNSQSNDRPSQIAFLPTTCRNALQIYEDWGIVTDTKAIRSAPI